MQQRMRSGVCGKWFAQSHERAQDSAHKSRVGCDGHSTELGAGYWQALRYATKRYENRASTVSGAEQESVFDAPTA